MFNNKEVGEYFSQLLTEEMGIIRNVQTDVQIITQNILKGIKFGKTSPTSLDLTTHKNGSFKESVNVSPDNIKNEKQKKEITVKWFYYSFSDLEAQKKQMKKIPYQTKYIPQIDTLVVVVLAIKGNVDNRTLFDSVAHELTHNFQRNVKDGDLLSNDNRLNIYKNANKNIGSQNEAFKWIGNVLYLTYNFEQDAFLNGAYAYIMKQYENGEDFIISYKETEAYVALNKLRYYLDAMQKASENGKVGDKIKDHCIFEYNLTFEKIINIGVKAYSRYSKKLARMCGQALSDIDKREKQHVPYHTMEFYEPEGLNEALKKLTNAENIFLK